MEKLEILYWKRWRCKIEEKYIFWLLCSLQKLDSSLYSKFEVSFGSIKEMYEISNNSLKFKQILIKNKMFFSNEVINKLVSSKLKIQSEKLLNIIHNMNIKIQKVKINDKYLYTFVYGNTNLLNCTRKKLYIFCDNNTSKYGIEKCKYFLNCKNVKENINVCIGSKNIKKNSCNISIVNIENVSELRTIQIERLDINNLYIFSLYNIICMLTIADVILIPEAKYTSYSNMLVSNFLDFGKDILVIPGDMWNKNCFFSNFLIREGANVILNINDLNIFL